MRLIDADEVLEFMRSRIDMQDIYLPIHFQDMIIDEMPTAYDIDKVVEELEKLPECNCCNLVEDAINIVKRGGVNDD